MRNLIRVLFLISLLSASGIAQELTGNDLGLEFAKQTGWLEGVVRAGETAIRDARITITNTATKQHWTVRSDEAGYFSLRLRYGSYRLRITKPGYEPLRRQCQIKPTKGCYITNADLQRRIL